MILSQLTVSMAALLAWQGWASSSPSMTVHGPVATVLDGPVHANEAQLLVAGQGPGGGSR
jgi:hypothetical protein